VFRRERKPLNSPLVREQVLGSERSLAVRYACEVLFKKEERKIQRLESHIKLKSIIHSFTNSAPECQRLQYQQLIKEISDWCWLASRKL